MGLSGVYNAPLSHEEGCSVIKEAYNRGITFFDTADAYGDKHDNEIMLGKVRFIMFRLTLFIHFLIMYIYIYDLKTFILFVLLGTKTSS